MKERCGEILDILLNAGGPVVINQIARKLSVSNRTIRNDLQEIEEFLSDVDKGEIVKKPRVGVWLEASSEEKRFLRNAIERTRGYIEPFSPEKRKLYILKRLLQSSESITMQFLADELYVSKVTISKDLDEVEEWLDKYNLRLDRKQNYGTEIVGDEKNWRDAAADLLTILKNNKEIRDMLMNTDEITPNSRLDYENYIQLKELFPDINARVLESILNEAEEKMEFHLSDESFDGLLVHIAISIKRLEKNKDIKMAPNQLAKIKKQKEYEIAGWIAGRIEEEFDLIIPEGEIGYITLHILGSKVGQNFQVNEAKNILDEMDSDTIDFAKEIIKLISNILSVDLNKDEKLLVGLVLHLRPTINRLKYGLSLRNPLLRDIKKNYPSVFGAAWATSVLFEKYLGVKVNEEEIGYIAIHIGAALERINKKIRVVVVCSSGIGTAQLVAVRLKKAVSNLEIQDIISVHDVEKLKDNNIDIIISTIPLKYEAKPVIQISPIVKDGDIEKIKNYIKNIKGTRHFNRDIIESRMNHLLNEELIFANLEMDSKDEVVNHLAAALIDKGYVVADFINSTMEREKITSTAVGKGVAIPHGTQDYVLEPVIAIATLKEPIDWSESKVDTVFLLALKFSSGNSTRNFFKGFYSILDNENILNKIRNCSTPGKIYEILLRKDDIYE